MLVAIAVVRAVVIATIVAPVFVVASCLRLSIVRAVVARACAS